MKNIILISTLLFVWSNTYSEKLFSDTMFDSCLSARLSYPYIFNLNYSTILSTETGFLCRATAGINGTKIGIGPGCFERDLSFGLIRGLGISLTANYLYMYNDLWIDDDFLNKSFIGLELGITLVMGIDIGIYQSIDTNKNEIFLFVFGLGLGY